MKKSAAIGSLALLIAASYWLYSENKKNAGYAGIPAVDCIDYTKPVKQAYNLSITILIDGKADALDPNIGHDPGNCLRSIYTDDATGIVKVVSNSTHQYSLGEFFNVWHKTFNAHELMGKEAMNGKQIEVFVNSNKVNSYENTILTPGSFLTIVYQ